MFILKEKSGDNDWKMALDVFRGGANIFLTWLVVTWVCFLGENSLNSFKFMCFPVWMLPFNKKKNCIKKLNLNWWWSANTRHKRGKKLRCRPPGRMSGNTNHTRGQMPGNEDLAMCECQKPRAGEARKESQDTIPRRGEARKS